MDGSVIFDPLLPLPVLWGVAGLAAAFLALAIWRGLSGWWLRTLAVLALVLAIANPSLQTEDRDLLSDILIAVVDESASQRIADRAEQTEAALTALEAEITALGNTELRVVRVGDGEGDQGTLLMSALAEAMAEEPRARLAGAVLITDGQVHDIDRAPALPAPLQVLLTGQEDDWDRRLIIKNAPAFAILGEPVTLTLRVEDQGRIPANSKATVPLEIAVDGGEPERFEVPVGQDMEEKLNNGGDQEQHPGNRLRAECAPRGRWRQRGRESIRHTNLLSYIYTTYWIVGLFRAQCKRVYVYYCSR